MTSQSTGTYFPTKHARVCTLIIWWDTSNSILVIEPGWTTCSPATLATELRLVLLVISLYNILRWMRRTFITQDIELNYLKLSFMLNYHAKTNFRIWYTTEGNCNVKNVYNTVCISWKSRCKNVYYTLCTSLYITSHLRIVVRNIIHQSLWNMTLGAKIAHSKTKNGTTTAMDGTEKWWVSSHL